MAYKALITKPNKDVLTVTSPDDFYLHSDYPLLKVFASGTFSFSTSIGSTEVSHNLGYKPYVLVFSQLVSYDYDLFEPTITTEYYQHDWEQQGISATWWGYTKIYDDKIEIRVNQSDAEGGAPSKTVNGFYYIFYDEVS